MKRHLSNTKNVCNAYRMKTLVSTRIPQNEVLRQNDPSNDSAGASQSSTDKAILLKKYNIPDIIIYNVYSIMEQYYRWAFEKRLYILLHNLVK